MTPIRRTLTMVFKLGLEAQKHWRRLQGFELISKSLFASVLSMEKNKPNKLLNQSFEQGCADPGYTTFDNTSGHALPRSNPGS
jgi:hypothetical protein